ncbi:MAG: DinB family protein [Vicinamibacterales bacterium]
MTAGELRQSILDEHERYRATIANHDEATLERTPVVGAWPIRDLTAHLTGWIDALLATAAHGLGGPEPAQTTITDFDAFNAANVAAAREMDWPAVLAALDAAVERSAGYVAYLSEPQLATAMDFPWGGRGTISRLLAIIPHHHHEHRQDVETWLAGIRNE